MKDQELLEQISKKLSALLALSFVKDVEKISTVERVKLLMRCGLVSNDDIASILDTTKGTVGVLKSRIKAKK